MSKKKKLLKQPKKLKNWDEASDLERLKNAQQFNLWKIQEIQLMEEPTKEDLSRLRTIQNQVTTLTQQMKGLK